MSGQFVLNHSEDSGRPLDPCPLPRSTYLNHLPACPWETKQHDHQKIGVQHVFLPTWVKCSAKICMYRKTIYPLTCPNCSWTKNITVTMSRASHPGDKSTGSTGWQHPPDLLLVDGCHTFLAQLRDNLVRPKSQMWPDWKLLSQHISASQIHMHIESFNQVH